MTLKQHKQPREPFIIAITGTKGKTTITRILEQIIRNNPKYGHNTFLRVDSDGHYVNGKRKSTHKQSAALKQAAPTVCPGKFMYELRDKTEQSVAVLETAIGSAHYIGMGVMLNHGGIFNNVYLDHLGIKIKTQKDLAKKKACLVFSKLSNWANKKPFMAFNVGDKRVASEAIKYIDTKTKLVIMYGIWENKKFIDVDNLIKNGAVAVFYHKTEDSFFLYTQDKKYKLGTFANVPWSLQGLHEPTVLAATASIAGYLGYAGIGVTNAKKAVQALHDVVFSKDSMRMQHLTHKKTGALVIVDFAHEKYSLIELSKYLRRLQKKQNKKGKLIAIVRFDPVRPDDLLQEYGRACATLFDEVIVYDKIATKKDYNNFRNKNWRRDAPGAVMKIVCKSLQDEIKRDKKSTVQNLHCIMQEEKALDFALKNITKDDILVYIPKSIESLSKLQDFEIK